MWRFVTARATGTSHSKAGLPCQDRLACVALGDDTLIAAVADGAGSAAKAELGAEVAVGTIIQSVSAAIEAGRTDFAAILRAAAFEAREKVLAAALEEGAEARDLASTLLSAVLGPAGGAALQIGDGVIVVNEDGNGWCWVFWPQRGEYANTTRFLTDEDAETFLQVAAFAGRPLTDIALTTDGLEPLALHYATKSVHEPFFEGIFGPLFGARGTKEITPLCSALAGFLASERVRLRTDDDVSLILATRRPHASQP